VRKIEVSDDEHSLFMALGIGYCYIKCVKQNAWIRLSDYTRTVRHSIKINKYWEWSDNFTAAFFVSFIATAFVPDIEGIQNKVICFGTV